MPPFGPVRRSELVRALRSLGFDGPYSGGKHQFMVRGSVTLRIPNPHQAEIGSDLLRIVAAYNGGPSPLIKTARQLGDDADVLMLIESLPAKETRDYVEQVMAGYWLYARQFGEESPSLAQLASGVSRISVLNR
mgnify:CR=1 FL=1